VFKSKSHEKFVLLNISPTLMQLNRLYKSLSTDSVLRIHYNWCEENVTNCTEPKHGCVLITDSVLWR
jgi:hypothetical protein